MTATDTNTTDTNTTESRLVETRTFAPDPALAGTWNVGPGIHAQAEADPTAFWEDAARRLDWAEPWNTALEWEPPTTDPATGELSVPAARWFVGGQLNVAENCVDRHVAAGRGEKVALHFEGEPGDRLSVTYADLRSRVSQAANALTDLGIGPGDRVVVYLPVLVETVVIALACARIGAVHSLVFGGFSAEAVRFRLQDTRAKLLVTSDGQFRRGKAVEVKSAADEAARDLPDLEHVLVVRRTGQDVAWTEGRDVWWHESVDRASEEHTPEPFDAEHPLFIIYTSGTTGKPKGLVHTSGGYLAHASWSHWAHFDAKESDVHWCTADLAWVTAHTYEIYGPLSNGLTQVITRAPRASPPRAPRDHRALRRDRLLHGAHPDPHPHVLVRRGAPVRPRPVHAAPARHRRRGDQPQAWIWFHAPSAAASCRSSTPGGSRDGRRCSCPCRGDHAQARIRDRPAARHRHGRGRRGDREVPAGVAGTLVARRPWPGMARTVWGDRSATATLLAGLRRMRRARRLLRRRGLRHGRRRRMLLDPRPPRRRRERLRAPPVHDRDRVGAGRRGQRAEAGAAGIDDALTGQAVAVFVIPRGDRSPDAAALRDRVAREIGPIAKPRHVIEVPDLPRTRSGKIMRRLLAQLVHTERARRAGRTPGPLGDVTSRQNPEAVASVADVLAALPADDPTVSPQD